MVCPWLRKIAVPALCLAVSIFGVAIANADIVVHPPIEKSSASSQLELVMEVLESPADIISTSAVTEPELFVDGPFWTEAPPESKKVPEPSLLSIPVFMLLIWAFVRLERKKTTSLRTR